MNIPEGHHALRGSERNQPNGATLLGPADPDEQITARIILRRRIDVPAIADLEAYLYTHPLDRPALSVEEHAERFGAAPADIDPVVRYLESSGLIIDEVHAASRTILAIGTAAQMNTVFSVDLEQYRVLRQPVARGRTAQATSETYRSHTDSVYVPADLVDRIIGVFGLHNRRIANMNLVGDPPITNPTTVPEVIRRYNFPTNSAGGQTIGIVACPNVPGTGYAQHDINSYFAAPALAGMTAPKPIPVTTIDGTTNDPTNPDAECTQDICIASTVAQGAKIAVYFNKGDETGWLGVLYHATFPMGTEPIPSVLSSSFSIAASDDPSESGIRTYILDGKTEVALLEALTMAFQDAGSRRLTVCVASGDLGTDSGMFDGTPHVSYPASDPWVLSCGGTTIGHDAEHNPVEYVWNDASNEGTTKTYYGATGGGVSAYFLQPAYQAEAGIPTSLSQTKIFGRGVPDVAANASWNSGYFPIYTIGNDPNPFNGNGTSAAAPLYAGLFAVINAALDSRVGFINPVLYQLANRVCRDLDPTDPSNQAYGGPLNNNVTEPPGLGIPPAAGYLAGPGWDACTGWGTIDGSALLNELKFCHRTVSNLLQSIGIEDIETMAVKLRRLRDIDLPRTEVGLEFVELVMTNTTTLARLVLEDETVHRLAVNALASWITPPLGTDLLQATIRAENVASMQLLVDQLSAAMPGQASTLRRLQALLIEGEGTTVAEMLGTDHQ